MALVADRGDSGEQHEDQIKHLETHLGYPPRHHQHIRQHRDHYIGQESKVQRILLEKKYCAFGIVSDF